MAIPCGSSRIVNGVPVWQGQEAIRSGDGDVGKTIEFGKISHKQAQGPPTPTFHSLTPRVHKLVTKCFVKNAGASRGRQGRLVLDPRRWPKIHAAETALTHRPKIWRYPIATG